MSSPRFSLAGNLRSRPGFNRARLTLSPEPSHNSINHHQVAATLESVYKLQNPQSDYQVIYVVQDDSPNFLNPDEKICYNYNGEYRSYDSFNNMCLGVAHIFGLDKYVDRYANRPGFNPEQDILNKSPTFTTRINTEPYVSLSTRSELIPYTLYLNKGIFMYRPYIMVSSPENATKLRGCLLEMVNH